MEDLSDGDESVEAAMLSFIRWKWARHSPIPSPKSVYILNLEKCFRHRTKCFSCFSVTSHNF